MPAGRVLTSLIAVGVLVAGGWTVLRAADQDAATNADPAVNGVIEQYPPADRQQADQFTAQLLDGSTFDSQDLSGKVSVFNVWGSWCGPCRKEAPALARAAGELDGRVQFVGINVRDNPAAARSFEEAFEIPYPSIHPDDSAAALLAFKGALASAAVPSTVVLDSDGRVAARAVGPVSYSTLRGLVEDVLDEDP